jgi:hypothetical protein
MLRNWANVIVALVETFAVIATTHWGPLLSFLEFDEQPNTHAD